MTAHTPEEIQRREDLIERNNDRAVRRQANPPSNSPVSDDEPEPFSRSPSPEDPFDTDICNLQKLSPSKFVPVMKMMMDFGERAKNAFSDSLRKARSDNSDAIDPSPSYVKNAVVFRLADEKSKSTTSRTYEVPDAIWQLVQNKVHIQLNSLTSANIKQMLENPGSIKTKKGIDNISSKLHLLDQSQFGREEEISQAQWHDVMIISFS